MSCAVLRGRNAHKIQKILRGPARTGPRRVRVVPRAARFSTSTDKQGKFVELHEARQAAASKGVDQTSRAGEEEVSSTR